MLSRVTIFVCSAYFTLLTEAVNLYVSSYDGNLTTLSLTRNAAKLSDCHHPSYRWHGPPWLLPNRGNDFTYTLTSTSTFNTTTQSPSWLTLNPQNRRLYLVDEAVTSGNGTLTTYRVSGTGQLTQLARLITLPGGVYATFFADGAALAVPHYSSSQLLTYSVATDGTLAPLQAFNFALDGPGPVPNRQDAPHPHEAILDPTGAYLLVPDLGADLVRVYSVDVATKLLVVEPPLVAQAGSGPRHGVFSPDTIEGRYVFYLVAEISATVTAYAVHYEAEGLVFQELPGGVYLSLGAGHPVPWTTTGESTGVTAEIAFSPDGKFVIASNRRDVSFNASTFPLSYPIPSDSMATWSIDPCQYDGSLDFLGLFPAGGSYPRQFSLSRAGDLAAVALQQSSKVVVLERNTESGLFVRQIAEVDVAGQVTCVVWDD